MIYLTDQGAFFDEKDIPVCHDSHVIARAFFEKEQRQKEDAAKRAQELREAAEYW